MPIRGRTDIVSENKGYPLLGRIFKGNPKRTVTRSDGKKVQIMGEDTDHFRVVFELENIENPSAEQKVLLQVYKDEWRRVYGDDPRMFDDVRLYYPTPDRAMESWYEQHDGNGLICRCNGDQKQLWWNNTSKRLDRTPAPCPFAQGGECGCSPVARLPIILMKFSLLTGIMGYFRLTTHSNKDIDNLHAAMCEVYAVAGDLTQVVFTLTRVPTRMSFTDAKSGQRGKTTKSLLSLYGGQQYTRKYIVPVIAQAQYAGLIGSDDQPPPLPPPKPAAQPRFPETGPVKMIDAPPPPPLVEPDYDYDPDESPAPPRPILSLKNMKVRNAFINAAGKHGLKVDDILDRCEVLSFNDLEWWQAAETLGLDLEPPADLLK